ncbi:cation transporting ATPase [Methylocaldum marinum]|uniref:Cation transporting ATPase n=1 Tax=Methylocaldum marinum TaxID=1432792 RepID=A0A286P3T2_9GAMM|nr:cation-transporting P-type ATPase [Methylocaldum marinum]BBA32304.1 cation transporting ATPase [Methylocaldum marinum]
MTEHSAEQSQPWHHLSADEVVARLKSHGNDGLPEDEAGRRLDRYGPNRLPQPKKRGPLRRFLAQFHNLLIYILIVTAVISALLDHWVDTYVILIVVLINAVIGFVQEGKAEKALEAIREMLAPNASVIRDGVRRTLPAEELVPGDVVLLEPGDKIPADLRILRSKNLQAQEAILTGESVPVEKSPPAVGQTAVIGDRRSMGYSGTLVSAGQGVGVVVATAAGTEIGRISGLLAEVETTTTPLLVKMDRFSRWLSAAIIVLTAVVFVYGVRVQEQDVNTMFMTVVGLVVSAIPEGLPAILTVTLAIGVQRMAGRKAIIRRLPAVETLGSVTVICSDKTGTLTRNEMTVRSVATAHGLFEVTGVGYDPHGGFNRDGREIEPAEYPNLIEVLRAAALCNDSALRQLGDAWTVEGDPMEGALLTAALKAGLDYRVESKRLPRTDVIPFDAEHRFMATLHHDHEGHGFIWVKGAPERILDMCAEQQAADGTAPLDRREWQRRVDAIASAGQRVLAVASMKTAATHRQLEFDQVGEGLLLLGLLGLQDPPREEAISAIGQCRSAGIRVKMITGDHAATALAIARQLRLDNCEEAQTGQTLDVLAPEAWTETADRVDVFARTTPEHKLRLVEALQAKGHVVAMTGDGVNDAPALKRADVGVAMGRNGTEAAKEASEMVLADDNFASIGKAVREGRTVYDNLKKAILFLLPVNGGESMSIVASLIAGLTLPITPLQILWVNMVSSVALAMALAFEPAEPNVMRRPPRPPDEPILSGLLVWRVAVVSGLFVAGVFGIFYLAQTQGSSVEEARTYAVNTLVALETFYLFNVRHLGATALSWKGLLANRAAWIAVFLVFVLQAIFTYAPFMERFFDTRPVDFVHGAEIFGIGLALFLILEMEKAFRLAFQRRRKRRDTGRARRSE